MPLLPLTEDCVVISLLFKKSYLDLSETFNNARVSDLSTVLENEKENMCNDYTMSFSDFTKSVLRENKLTQQEVFFRAGIPERYGYKLLSGEKRTRQRDVILRICYAAQFTIEQLIMALQLYGMPSLYLRFQRDAAIFVYFKEHPGTLEDMDEKLIELGFSPLKTAGMLD